MKNFLIVGGSSGIGLQLVQNLATDHRVFATFCNSQPSQIQNVTYAHLDVLNEQLDNDASNNGVLTHTINVSELTKGVYIVNLQTESNSSFKRVVIQ